MRPAVVAASAALLVALSGCTWVHMAPGASAVRVIPAGAAPGGCEQRGEITVTVTNKVGFYERNPVRVREELETSARNEAPALQADTMQALSEPRDGEQRFAAYRCRR
ncbi:DUF4156 domain-containing protein [Lysobacter solisilvae (ex Woo and Kim 2020)]|uniref:DUF4156 domain-containing protein n=1 Tax=Agrilutibacter terrestris TaxID=2865112 RepID=A0A7H0G0R7_9GAMM|nr:DUF4156 domain-containing protein [Lysobacter terrestris]QNP41883.1 DUF4156 domain-containing protein [Lysobacter terrestris]